MLKVMTFNLLFGGGDEARFRKILAIIEKAAPDILALQECLGWAEENAGRLAQVQEAMRADHAHLGHARPRGSGKRYHVALLSKGPMKARTFADPAFLGHALVQAEVSTALGPLTVFCAHFDSHNENLRFVEARYLRSLIPAEQMQTERLLLLGDLNAMSKRDPYPEDLADRLLRAKINKYHHPPRFEVIDELEASGWVDTLWRENPKAWITAPRDRGGVRIDYRTDFVFASPTLIEALRDTRIIELSKEAPASDHFPIIARFATSDAP